MSDQQRGTGLGEEEGLEGTPGQAQAHGQAQGLYFEHERLHVYEFARQFFEYASDLIRGKIDRELRDQFNRATISLLSNIGEGAGKTAKADKQRFYEIAKGSALEAATQLDMMHMRRYITDAQYQRGRQMLIKIARILHALCRPPRTS